MEIFIAKPNEIDAVLQLHTQGLQHELKFLNSLIPGKSFNPKGLPQLRTIFSRVIQMGEGQLFVAKDKDQIIGYCLATKKRYPVEKPGLCGCINGIYVLPNYRRQKIAYRLFDESVLWLKQGQVTYLELNHMINDPVSTAFWKSLGFVPVQLSCSRLLD